MARQKNLPRKPHQHVVVAVKFYGPKADTGERRIAPPAQRKLQAQRVGPPYVSIQLCLAARLQTSPVLHSARCLPSPPTSQDENAVQGFFIERDMKEIWVPVRGFSGRYEVSNKGRVRSLPQVIICEGPVKGRYTSVRQGSLLRPGRMPNGHLSVSLGRRNSQCVHKLVLNAFVGPAPDGYECLHINGDPADNRLQNLRWGTRSENIADAVRHGTWMTPERKAALDKGRQTRWGKK